MLLFAIIGWILALPTIVGIGGVIYFRINPPRDPNSNAPTSTPI